MKTAVLWVLVLAGDGTILARHSEAGSPKLPTATFGWDDDERLLPPARRAIVEQLGVSSPVLEIAIPPDSDTTDPASILVVHERPSDGWRPGAGLEWVPASTLEADDLPEPVRARVLEWLAEAIGTRPVPVARPAWSRPGWLARVTRWLDEQLEDRGRIRTGPLEQVRLWGISALVRGETDQGAIWIKAAYPPFGAEPRITRFLATRFPDDLPVIVATNEGEGWTALEDFGPLEVAGGRHGDLGRATIARFAEMQRAMTPHLDALLAAGAARRPLAALPDDLAAAFAEDPAPIEWEQSPARLVEMVNLVRAHARNLASLGIPETLVHGDFHPWNVAVRDGRPVIFDWTDAAVSHPLIDFATWVSYIEDESARPAIWEHWVEAWSASAPAEELRARFGQVLALGAAYQVVSYAAITRNLEPASRPPIAPGAADFARILDRALTAGDSSR